MFLKFLILVLQFAFIASTAHAAVTKKKKNCPEEVLPPQPTAIENAVVRGAIQDLMPMSEYDLPGEFLSRLSKDPYYRALRSAFGDGSELSIAVEPTQLDNGNNGEFQLARFLSKVLRAIFPTANFKQGYGSALGYQFLVSDYAEYGASAPETAPASIIEPLDIKMANPGPGQQSRSALRAKLGIPQDSKVVSLNNSFYNTSDDISELVDKITPLNNPKPDVIIVSSAILGRVENIRPPQTKKAGYNYVNLSELRPGLMKPRNRYVVLNDTVQKMYAVYGVADVNVTAGAVSLAEPLNAKTPTIFFSHRSKYMHKYSPTAFKLAGEQAVKTGGGRVIEDIEALPEALASLLHDPPKKIKPPYGIKTQGSSPLDILMRKIAESFIRQTGSGRILARFMSDESLRQFSADRAKKTLGLVLENLSKSKFDEAWDLSCQFVLPDGYKASFSTADVQEIEQLSLKLYAKIDEMMKTNTSLAKNLENLFSDRFSRANKAPTVRARSV